MGCGSSSPAGGGPGSPAAGKYKTAAGSSAPEPPARRESSTTSSRRPSEPSPSATPRAGDKLEGRPSLGRTSSLAEQAEPGFGEGQVNFKTFLPGVNEAERSLSRMQRAFLDADLNGNGLIDKEEFNTLLRISDLPEAGPMVSKLFDVLDLNDTGTIEFKEFVYGMSRFDGVGYDVGLVRFVMRLVGAGHGPTATLRSGDLAELFDACVAAKKKGHEQWKSDAQLCAEDLRAQQGGNAKVGTEALSALVLKYSLAFEVATKTWAILSDYVKPCRKLVELVCASPGHKHVFEEFKKLESKRGLGGEAAPIQEPPIQFKRQTSVKKGPGNGNRTPEHDGAGGRRGSGEEQTGRRGEEEGGLRRKTVDTAGASSTVPKDEGALRHKSMDTAGSSAKGRGKGSSAEGRKPPPGHRNSTGGGGAGGGDGSEEKRLRKMSADQQPRGSSGGGGGGASTEGEDLGTAEVDIKNVARPGLQHAMSRKRHQESDSGGAAVPSSDGGNINISAGGAKAKAGSGRDASHPMHQENMGLGQMPGMAVGSHYQSHAQDLDGDGVKEAPRSSTSYKALEGQSLDLLGGSGEKKKKNPKGGKSFTQGAKKTMPAATGSVVLRA